MRKYRHYGQTTKPQESIEIESMVWRYQLGDDKSDLNLNIIMDTCKPILKNRGIAWDATAEKLVMDTVERFNPFFGIGFLTFLISCLESKTGPRRPYTAEDTLEADAYDGTGFTTFDRSWTSVEERLTVNTNVRTREGVPAYEEETDSVL